MATHAEAAFQAVDLSLLPYGLLRSILVPHKFPTSADTEHPRSLRISLMLLVPDIQKVSVGCGGNGSAGLPCRTI